MTIDREAFERVVRPLRKERERDRTGYAKAVLERLLAHRVTPDGDRFSLQDADVLCRLAEEIERKGVDTSPEMSQRFAGKLDAIESLNGVRFGTVILAIQSGDLTGVDSAIMKVESRKTRRTT